MEVIDAQSMLREIGAGWLVLHAVAAVSVILGFTLYATGVLPAIPAIGGLMGLACLTSGIAELIRSVMSQEAVEPFYPEVDGLPQTSAAEFRAAAWKLWYTPGTGSMGGYIPAFGLRSWAALATGTIALACVEEMFTPGRVIIGLGGFLFCGVLTVLLIGTKAHSNRKRYTRNAQLRALAYQVEQKRREGEIPLAPEDWDRPIPSPLT